MTIDANGLNKVKLILREKDIPYFSDDEIQQYSDLYPDEKRLLYELLLIKSQNNSLNISGITTNDDSQYFKMLAQRYRPNNSGILKQDQEVQHNADSTRIIGS